MEKIVLTSLGPFRWKRVLRWRAMASPEEGIGAYE